VQPAEIFVDDESKLTLHGLQQYYVKLDEAKKNRKLNDLVDALEFNQTVIFVNGVRRAQELNKLLVEHNFPSMAIYGGLSQDERLDRYNKFKESVRKQGSRQRRCMRQGLRAGDVHGLTINCCFPLSFSVCAGTRLVSSCRLTSSVAVSTSSA